MPASADRCASMAHVRSSSVGRLPGAGGCVASLMATPSVAPLSMLELSRREVGAPSQDHLDAPVDAEARLLKSHRVLEVPVEEVVDAGDERPALRQLVGGRDID